MNIPDDVDPIISFKPREDVWHKHICDIVFDGNLTSWTKLLNENITIQHRSCRHWSLIVNIYRDKAVQDFTIVSMVKAPLSSKRGRKGGTFVGEYIVIDDAARIGCPHNLGTFCLLVPRIFCVVLKQLQISFMQCIS